MNDFKFWQHVDTAVIDTETRKASKAAKIPSVWPSEASADAIASYESKIIGKCHRASFLRMIAVPITNAVDVVGAWRWITGRLIETHMTDMCKEANIFVANGVRTIVEELYLPLEMDQIVIDPISNDGYIIECKTYYGYMAKKDIESLGQPKTSNLMQVCLYLNEFQTGAKLKEVIKQSLADKSKDVRNRIEVDEANLAKMNDGPLGAKLVYISRDECLRKEFNISMAKDFDGLHYPVVDGQMYRTFNIESLYNRYKTLQKYWFAARVEAVRVLSTKGIERPESLKLVLKPGDELPNAEFTEIELTYLAKLEDTVRTLPDTFWPPAEYEWSYSAEKIERLYSIGEIGKTKYTDWKKKKAGKDRIGSWNCSYCQYKRMCIPRQSANFASFVYNNLEDFNLDD